MSEGTGSAAQASRSHIASSEHYWAGILLIGLALAGPLLGVLLGKGALLDQLRAGWYSLPLALFGLVALTIRVRSPQDYYGGVALAALALFALWACNDLPGMRGFAFGPGTVPRLFAFTLGILSLGVVVGGLLIAGPHVSSYKLRGVIFIIGAILAFAACIRPLGLVIASFCTMIICAAAAEDVKWRETLIVAIVVTAFCSILFPYGLNLPFQLWPRFW